MGLSMESERHRGSPPEKIFTTQLLAGKIMTTIFLYCYVQSFMNKIITCSEKWIQIQNLSPNYYMKRQYKGGSA